MENLINDTTSDKIKLSSPSIPKGHLRLTSPVQHLEFPDRWYQEEVFSAQNKTLVKSKLINN